MTISLLLTLFSLAAAVSNAWMTWRVSQMASKIRSHASLQAEMRAIDDCVRLLVQGIKRIEGRQTGLMRKNSRASESPTNLAPIDSSILANPALSRYRQALIDNADTGESNGSAGNIHSA
jgi:hypothetical protein